MKLNIEIQDNLYVEKFLSILSVGILECLEKKLISSEDAMKMLYQPGNIERFSLISSDLKNAIHLGTELDDVKRIIPERYIESIEQIRHINYKLVSNDLPRGKYVTYELLADSE